MTNHGSNEHPELAVQPFDANTELNDYEVSHNFFPPTSLSPRPSFIRSTSDRTLCVRLRDSESFFSSFTHFTDPLGVTRFDCGRARGPLLRERFRQPAQRFP